MSKHIIHIDLRLCIGCGLCLQDCPVHNLQILQHQAVVKDQDCMKCGHCVAACPKNAISMDGFFEQPVDITTPVTLHPVTLLQAIQSRRSIRQFTSQDVSPKIIQSILEVGRYTPTARNLQNISYIVIRNQVDAIEKIAVQKVKRLLPLAKLVSKQARNAIIDDHFFFKHAPVIILVMAKGAYAKVNGSLAASNMALMAEAHHLGVLYSGFFTAVTQFSFKLRKVLGLKRNDKVIATLVLGYPSVTYYRTAQREPANIREI